jgi:hypothetical protein
MRKEIMTSQIVNLSQCEAPNLSHQGVSFAWASQVGPARSDLCHKATWRVNTRLNSALGSLGLHPAGHSLDVLTCRP